MLEGAQEHGVGRMDPRNFELSGKYTKRLTYSDAKNDRSSVPTVYKVWKLAGAYEQRFIP